MEIPSSYLNKIRPAARKEGAARCDRDEKVAAFMQRLNAECERDGFPLYTTGRLVRMFKGRSDSELYAIFRSCDRADSFGGLLTYILKPKTT